MRRAATDARDGWTLDFGQRSTRFNDSMRDEFLMDVMRCDAMRCARRKLSAADAFVRQFSEVHRAAYAPECHALQSITSIVVKPVLKSTKATGSSRYTHRGRHFDFQQGCMRALALPIR